jgi:hypothetical protein
MEGSRLAGPIQHITDHTDDRRLPMVACAEIYVRVCNRKSCPDARCGCSVVQTQHNSISTRLFNPSMRLIDFAINKNYRSDTCLAHNFQKAAAFLSLWLNLMHILMPSRRAA